MEQVVFGFVPKIALVAFGGNALLPKESDGTQEEQEALAREAAVWLVDIIKQGYELVVVHGNGPQVGNILIQVEQSVLQIPPISLDVAVAQTQGSIGFLLQSAIRNELVRRKISKDVVTLLSEVEVDADDPAFQNPTKPVGPFFNRFRAKVLTEERGWTMKEESSRGFRKVVASPKPKRILNFDVIRRLVTGGTVTIAAGGGGIPVVRSSDGTFRGVEAVIDKDYASSLLAAELKADLFIVLTGVPRVVKNFGKKNEEAIAGLTVNEARVLMKQGQFPAGSMGPKVDASIRFVEAGGSAVLITDARHIKEALLGNSGTFIRPDPSPPARGAGRATSKKSKSKGKKKKKARSL
ncbi:MAG: carbamate kinase [Thermoanaerobaculia bacterium]